MSAGEPFTPTTAAHMNNSTVDPFASVISRSHSTATQQNTDVVIVPSTITEAECEDEDRLALEDAVEEVLEGRGAEEFQRRTFVSAEDDEEKGNEMVPISETAEVMRSIYVLVDFK